MSYTNSNSPYHIVVRVIFSVLVFSLPESRVHDIFSFSRYNIKNYESRVMYNRFDDSMQSSRSNRKTMNLSCLEQPYLSIFVITETSMFFRAFQQSSFRLRCIHTRSSREDFSASLRTARKRERERDREKERASKRPVLINFTILARSRYDRLKLIPTPGTASPLKREITRARPRADEGWCV